MNEEDAGDEEDAGEEEDARDEKTQGTKKKARLRNRLAVLSQFGLVSPPTLPPLRLPTTRLRTS